MGDKAMFCSSCGASLEEAAASPTNDKAVNENAAPGSDNETESSANQTPPYQYRPPYQPYDPKDHTPEFDPADIADNKLFASLPYFLGIVGIIAALLVQGSPYTRFHVKNEVRLLIASLLACIPLLVPVIGWIVSGIALTVLCVLKIIVIIEVLQGKAKEIPIISDIGFLK